MSFAVSPKASQPFLNTGTIIEQHSQSDEQFKSQGLPSHTNIDTSNNPNNPIISDNGRDGIFERIFLDYLLGIDDAEEIQKLYGLDEERVEQYLIWCQERYDNVYNKDRDGSKLPSLQDFGIHPLPQDRRISYNKRGHKWMDAAAQVYSMISPLIEEGCDVKTISARTGMTKNVVYRRIAEMRAKKLIPEITDKPFGINTRSAHTNQKPKDITAILSNLPKIEGANAVQNLYLAYLYGHDLHKNKKDIAAFYGIKENSYNAYLSRFCSGGRVCLDNLTEKIPLPQNQCLVKLKAGEARMIVEPLLRAGYTVSEICLKTGIVVATIYAILRKLEKEDSMNKQSRYAPMTETNQI